MIILKTKLNCYLQGTPIDNVVPIPNPDVIDIFEESISKEDIINIFNGANQEE